MQASLAGFRERTLVRSVAVAAVFATAFSFSAAGRGEDGAGTARSPLPDLRGRLSGIQFSIQGGHIEAISQEAGVEREQTTNLGESRQEKLVVNASADANVTIKYELTTATEVLTVDVLDGDQISISRRPVHDGKGMIVEFNQPQDGPLTLTVSGNGTAKAIHGDTIWHLLLAEPDLCAQQLVPLVEMFRPDWHLVESAQTIESQMLRTAQDYRPENIKRWSGWVSELASDRFSDRQRADRELRGAGTAVLPYLASLDRRKLDFEQVTRIRRMLETADSDDEDVPEKVATHLMGDRLLWVCYLERHEAMPREIAAQQLAFLLGHPIKFDAQAGQAVRAKQLRAVRQVVEAETPDNDGSISGSILGK